mmetsp:Transcript_5303/g.19036  ORF Transcript_5303/g.19036 Transcript_5303/m.19036 type:complete len:329 (+) Transcript_5303:143-1129(+)
MPTDALYPRTSTRSAFTRGLSAGYVAFASPHVPFGAPPRRSATSRRPTTSASCIAGAASGDCRSPQSTTLDGSTCVSRPSSPARTPTSTSTASGLPEPAGSSNAVRDRTKLTSSPISFSCSTPERSAPRLALTIQTSWLNFGGRRATATAHCGIGPPSALEECVRQEEKCRRVVFDTGSRDSTALPNWPPNAAVFGQNSACMPVISASCASASVCERCTGSGSPARPMRAQRSRSCSATTCAPERTMTSATRCTSNAPSAPTQLLTLSVITRNTPRGLCASDTMPRAASACWRCSRVRRTFRSSARPQRYSHPSTAPRSEKKRQKSLR